MARPTARAVPTHAPMSQFDVCDELLIHGIPVSRLAARVGQTPFYAYDRSLLGTGWPTAPSVAGRCPVALRDEGQPDAALVAAMARLVDGIDVASGGELNVALDAGANPPR